ncbi:Gfo/Idh/MocA family oxidoreductase [Paenibacillus sp. TRM 82003]|nr:Gfo/Idh/MocA family oxidoreductase [Paenibacillus sp. TRM 82003]
MSMNIGVVGLGWPGQQHVQAIEAFPERATLTAVCDTDEKKLVEFNGRCATYSDLDTFFAEGDAEAVVLAVPHHVHAELTVKALDAGKHVIIEKPMARSVAECERMIEAAERNGRTLMVAHNWRYEPWCIAAKRIVDSGELGDIRAVRTEWLLNFRPAFPKGSWIYDGEKAGGGALVSLAIHNLDALRFIVGEIEEVFTHQLHTDAWSTNGAENWAMAQMKFENGAIGHLFTGTTPFHPPEQGMLYIYGERGTLFSGPYRGENGLWIRSESRGSEPDAPYERVDVAGLTPGLVGHPQTNQMKHFLDCVTYGTRPETDGREIVKTIALVERIYASGQTGEKAKV